MKIESEIRGPLAIVTLSGKMDADHAGAFEAECRRLAAAGPRHIIADLSQLDYVSSMGLRSFLTVAKERETAKGSLVLAGLKGFVRQVFDLTRLTPLFRQFDSAEAAARELE